MNGRFYHVKEREDDLDLCPLCSSRLAGCHIGTYCGDRDCGYVDGICYIKDIDLERFKDKIQK